jgi:hypothetical protein
MLSRRRTHPSTAAVALLAALSLVSPGALFGGQAPAAPAVRQALVDGGWPQAQSTASGGHILIYQPQVADWTDQLRLTAYSAVAFTPSGAQAPSLGTVKFEARTAVSMSQRLVSFSDMTVVESSFPTLPKEQLREVVSGITRNMPSDVRVIALDRVLASIDTSKIIPKNVDGVKAEPPPIFFSRTPAVLVNIDGEPILSPIKDNDLKYTVNTNWDLFQHGPTGMYYLRYNDTWLQASNLKGGWQAAGKLPDSFDKLPADDNWKAVRASVPGRRVPASQVPRVFVSTTPSELILLAGEPKYQPVTGTNLLWVSNTESDVFRAGATGLVYYLVAGRWFSSPDFAGPWTFATASLPPDFRRIPLEHERSRVLASVPGTAQAAEAVLLAQVPQTARVNVKELPSPDVRYEGEPKFLVIQGTSLQYAVNTDMDIIKVGDLYYMCFQGVWFMSMTPAGPWTVTSHVPAEIYTIPVSSPVHNVTYVTIVEDNHDGWVTFAAVAGYTGMMIAWGCAVWGTGYYYPPYWGWGPYYPWYYPRYPTFGYSAWYNPWTGAYGRASVVYGPYGGAGAVARYNPATGTYSRGAVAWGPYGARGAAEAYNPRTSTYGQTRQGAGVYGSWGTTSVERGDEWAQTSRVTNRATGGTTRVTANDEGGKAVTHRGPESSGGIARTAGGDVYAGRDGNVYRNQDGTWQKYGDGGWTPVEPPPRKTDAVQHAGAQAGDRAAAAGGGQVRDRAAAAGVQVADRPADVTRPTDRPTIDQLNRDAGARRDGTERTGDYGNYRAGGGQTSRAAGTYRPAPVRPGGGGGGRRR